MYVRVHVVPDARREAFHKEGKDTWRIAVKEPAERNLANERVRTLIAREHGVPLSNVRILTGHTSRTKLLSVNTSTTN